MARIRRDFLPEDLQSVLDASCIDGCIAVQADQTMAETDFLLGLANRYDFIKAVVGWVDLKDPDLVSVLDQWENEQTLVGFRHIVQVELDPEFMLDPAFQSGLQLLGQRGYSYDLLVFPHQLSQAIETVKRNPDVTFVLDHLAKPYIKTGDYDLWSHSIHSLASFPNVACKISGMVTEADWATWTYDDLLPVMETALEAFGPRRLLFGSDWPVCLLAAEYDAVLDVVQRFISTLSESEKAGIMGDNAVRWYGIERKE